MKYCLRINAGDDDLARVLQALRTRNSDFSEPPVIRSSGTKGHRAHDITLMTTESSDLSYHFFEVLLHSLLIPRYDISV
jgi:hypothetical protein